MFSFGFPPFYFFHFWSFFHFGRATLSSLFFLLLYYYWCCCCCCSFLISLFTFFVHLKRIKIFQCMPVKRFGTADFITFKMDFTLTNEYGYDSRKKKKEKLNTDIIPILIHCCRKHGIEWFKRFFSWIFCKNKEKPATTTFYK